VTPLERYDDHRRAPRSIGKLLNASAVGDVGSIVAGDALRFYVKIDDGRISAAKFQVFNAGDQVAAASAVAELVVGRDLAGAQALSAAEVRAHFGGLDAVELPAQLWGIEGLRAALAAWTGGTSDGDRELDPVLCRCHGVSEETVRQAIRVNDAKDVESLTALTGAGSGCGTCRADVVRLLDEASAPAPAAAAAPGPGRGRIGVMQRINRTVAQLAVGWQVAGGSLEPWDLDGTIVRVKAVGSFVGDADARRTALADLEAALKAQVDPSLGVAEAG
jgi:NifU-like protein